MYVTGHKCRLEYSHRATVDKQHRGRSKGRVQGVRTPPPPSPPRDDLRFSNTTGILQKKLCVLLVLIILDPPLQQSEWVSFRPNHNPKKSFSFKGNYLSLLFNNKRLVTYTGDLCSVPSKQLKLWFFWLRSCNKIGRRSNWNVLSCQTFWLYHSQTSLMA